MRKVSIPLILSLFCLCCDKHAIAFQSNPTSLVTSRHWTSDLRRSVLPTLHLKTRETIVEVEQTTAQIGTSLVETETKEGYGTVIFLLWVVAILSALDRVAMSVAIVPMATEFDYTDTIKGSISSFFSVGYGLLILPTGLVLSKLSPKKIMAFGLSSWSLATIATPLVATSTLESLTPLLVVRACVGAAESVVIPTVQRLLATWTTAEQKSFAIATIFSGFHTGTILAYFMSPYIIDTAGGWRGLFFVYGGLGLFTVIPWLLFAKDSPESSRPTVDVTRDTSRPIQWSEVTDTLRQAPLKAIAQSKGVWAMLSAHAAKNVGVYISLAWTPTFYAEQYGIGVKDSALLSILPSVAGALGGLFAGSVADSVIRNLDNPTDAKSLTRVRKIFQSIGLYGPALALGTLAWNIPEEAWVAQLFLTAAVGLQAFNAAGYEAGNQEKAGEKWAGLLYSLTSLPAVMLGTGAVYVTGQILEATDQNWSYVFALNAAINVVGATAFALLYDSKREFD